MTDPVAGERRRQLRAAGLAAGALVVLGALLGLLWEALSPPGPIGIQLPDGIQPDETEAWAAGDGRFAVIALVVGLVAAVVAWYLPVLRRARGPFVALGLAVGGVVGALLTDLVGWAVRGDGPTYECGAGTCLAHLPLTVHMHGLWFLQAFVAVLVYGLFVSFAVSDDLGRADPGRERVRRPDVVAVGAGQSFDPSAGPSIGPSVGAQHHPQDGGRHGDAAGMP